MLELKNVFKGYTVGDSRQEALDGVSLKFRAQEFVAILGPSGAGKTTLQNIIGGLTQYDRGDVLINGHSTKRFTDAEWAAYRGQTIGTIFQKNEFIPYLSIADNVEMALSFAMMPEIEKRKRVLEALEMVGLGDHIFKFPRQLSTEQTQRMAIARALVNNPEIILADEPTGALDSASDRHIMNILHSVSQRKLVILFTHNPQLAKTYASRIIELRDGEIISDSDPVEEPGPPTEWHPDVFGLRWFTALWLSHRYIQSQRLRTLITALVSSLGVTGFSIVSLLYKGYKSRAFAPENDLGFSQVVLYHPVSDVTINVSGPLLETGTFLIASFIFLTLVIILVSHSVSIYISALQRREETSILRLLGARKQDITRLLTAEALISGFFSGLIGITVSLLLTQPINSLLEKLVSDASLIRFTPADASRLVLTSALLAYLASILPARFASKKNPLDILRTE